MKKFFAALLCLLFLVGCRAEMKDAKTAETESSKQATNVAETTVKIDSVLSESYSTDKVVWGPGRGENHSRPADPISLQERYGELGAQFILSDDKFICLTFDEGYENGFTPAILDILKEKKVKAVFFVTYDFASANPDLIERMIDEGHVIGNHSYRHLTMDEIPVQEATEEVSFLDKYMKQQHRYRMKLFRFPKGEFSESTLALVNSLGYKNVFWSFAYADWDTDNQADSDSAYKEITDNFHNGEIILLHAVSETNAKILGAVIDEARAQGYEFTTEI